MDFFADMHGPRQGAAAPSANRAKIAVVTSHPIQYQSPLLRALAFRAELDVFYAHRPEPEEQIEAGFGISFGWDVDLLSGYRSHFMRNLAARPSATEFFGCDTPEIEGRLRDGCYDACLVMGWHFKSYWQAIRACRKLSLPVLVRGDSVLARSQSPLKRLIKPLSHRLIVKQFDGLLYVGQKNRAYLEHYGARPDRLFFSPHCVDAQIFTPTHAPKAEAAQAPTMRTALFVGRLIDLKRPRDLLEAASRLNAAGRSTRLVFAGSGPLEGELKAMALARGVDATMVGFANQSELPAIYRAADALALMSDEETWGLVVNEAMACGTPAVVSSAVGCAPDMIDSGTGRTYPVGDVAALAVALDEVLDWKLTRAGRLTLALAEKTRHYSACAAADGVVSAVLECCSRHGTTRSPSG